MALSKEFYLDEIRSKYPNSYNESLKDLPVKDLEDMLDFLDQALEKADGGVIGIEVLFRDKKANGGRVPMVSGGALKGLMSLFKGGDKAEDLLKQEKIFREGPITAKFLEDVDSKVIDKFVRTRDAKGVGSYGLYDNFDDMPAGLKAAEIIKRFVDPKTGKINYDSAEFFIGRKLKGDETIDELIDIAISKPIGMGKGPFKDFEEYVLNPAKKADGGRVGLFMGGDPLTGQALQIYNSMKGYNFSDQEIADALSARGLYTPTGSGSTTTAPEGIIGAQLNQDRDDGPKGDFGLFGDLLKDTEKTFTKNVYTEIAPGKFDFVPTEVTGYKNVKTGNYQTEKGKNINHLGIEVPTIAGMLFDKNFGKGPQPGDIEGTFTKGIPTNMKNFFSNPFSIFQKQQATLKEIQDMNKKAVDDLRAKQAAEEAARQRDAAVASGLDAAIREGRDTSGFDRPSSGAYAEGAGMGVGGGYASDYFGADGGSVPTGLATRFKPRRR